MSTDLPVKAVVQRVSKGPHGWYAVSKAETIEGSITFALSPGIWDEPEYPEEGSVVLLQDIRAKRAGWRAHKARFLRPCIEGGEKK